MKKAKVCAVLALSILILVTILNPLRRSEEHIRRSMLEDTPIGTSIEDVIDIIENKEKWEIIYVSYEHGYFRRGPSVGEKSIRALIGDYGFLFLKTSVSVYWGFDEDSKLIEIAVWKSTDVI